MDDPMTTDNQSTNPGGPPQGRLSDHLNPQGAARLLGISLDGANAGQRDPDETIGELLEAHLGRPWCVEDEARRRVWPRLVRQVLGRNGSPALRTVGELLLDRQAKLDTIRQIRDRAKAQAAREGSELEHAVMTTLYFAAIANALSYHRTKITTYSYASLESSFEKLIRKAWMPADLAELFRQAVKMCRQQSKDLE